MSEIDWTKPLQTEDGRAVYYIGDSPREARWKIVEWEPEKGTHKVTYAVNGTVCGLDIINAPPPMVARRGWAFREKETGCLADTEYSCRDDVERERRRRFVNPDDWMIVKVTWTEPAPEPEPEADDGPWVVYSGVFSDACFYREGHDAYADFNTRMMRFHGASPLPMDGPVLARLVPLAVEGEGE